MNLFWIMAAGLIALSTVVILFIWLPKLRRQQQTSTGAPSFLAGQKAPPVIGSAALLLFAMTLYLALDKTDTSMRNPIASQGSEHVKAIEELAVRLARNPDDGKGWAMLARTHAITGRYKEAVEAYEKAAGLIPSDPILLVDYADVLAMVNSKRMQGKPLELLRQALKIDPDNTKGLALMGTAAFQAGDYTGAEKHWNRLLPLLPPDSQMAAQIRAGLAEARAAAKQKPRTAPP